MEALGCVKLSLDCGISLHINKHPLSSSCSLSTDGVAHHQIHLSGFRSTSSEEERGKFKDRMSHSHGKLTTTTGGLLKPVPSQARHQCLSNHSRSQRRKTDVDGIGFQLSFLFKMNKSPTDESVHRPAVRPNEPPTVHLSIS